MLSWGSYLGGRRYLCPSAVFLSKAYSVYGGFTQVFITKSVLVFSPAEPEEEAAQRRPRRVVLAEVVFVELGAIGVILEIAFPVWASVPVVRLEESSLAAFHQRCDAEAHPATKHVNNA